MKPIRIFRHDDWIGAGYFVETLDRLQIAYELIAIDTGDIVTDRLEDASGLVFLGGTMSVNDPLTWVDDELNLIRNAAKRKFPVFGHCFGAQLISKALGGSISKMPAKEIGWHAIEFKDNEITREWFNKLPRTIKVMLWHEDAMTLPQGATPLYSTAFCPQQAFIFDNMIATIPHIEVTSAMLKNWLDLYGYDLTPISASVQSIEEVSSNLDMRIRDMQQLSDVLYKRWLDIVRRYNQT